MKIKVFAIFSILILAISSCGRREVAIPRYKFKLNTPIIYNMKGNANLMVDVGMFSYNSDVKFSAIVVFTPVETNENGYKILMQIKEAKIEDVPNPIAASYHIGVNTLRAKINEFYLDEFGNAKVYIDNIEVPYFGYIVNLFFSKLDNLENVQTFRTNIPGWWQKIQVISVFEKNSGFSNKGTRQFDIFQNGKVIVYQKEDFEKSVEPTPIATGKYELIDNFDLLAGKSLAKDIKFDVKCDLPIKQEFLTIYLRIYANGTMNFKLFEPKT